MNIGDVFLTVRANLSAFQADLAKLNSDVSRTATSMGKTLSNVGAGLSKTGGAMTRNLTLPILAAGGAAGKFALDFDTSLRQVVALTDVTQGEIGGIRDRLLELAPAIGVGPQELAEAFYFVASAGFDAKESLEILEIAARGSAAGMGEAQDVAKVLASVINAYGIENLDAATAADQLTAAVGKGSAEAADFAGVIGRVAPGAAALGVSFDQVTAALAGMTNAGISADEAATSLVQIFSSLLKPTTQAETAMDNLGLSGAGLRRQLREEGLLSTLRTLEERFAGNETASAEVFGNIRALRGITALLGIDTEQLNGIFAATADSLGSLSGAYEDTEGPQREIDRAMADIQATAIELGTDVLPIVVDVLKQLAGGAKELAEWWRSLDDGTKRLIVQTLAFAAAAGPVLLVVGKLTSGLGGMFKMVGFLSSAKGIPRMIGFLKGPGGLAALAFGAALAIGEMGSSLNNWLRGLGRSQQELKNFKTLLALVGDEARANEIEKYLSGWGIGFEDFARVVETAGGDVEAAFEALQNQSGDLNEAMLELVGGATTMTEEWADAWRSNSTKVTTSIGGMLTSAKRAGGDIPGALAGGLEGGAGAVGDGAEVMTEEMLQALADAREAAGAEMQGLVNDILGILADSHADLKDEARQLREDITNPYKDTKHVLDLETNLAMAAILKGINSGSTPAAAAVAAQVEDWLDEYELLEPGVLETGAALNPALRAGIDKNLDATIEWVKQNVIGDQLALFDSLPEALDAAGFDGLAAYARGVQRAHNLRVVASMNAVRAGVESRLNFNGFDSGYNVASTYAAGLNRGYWDWIVPKAEQIRAGLGGFLEFAGSPPFTGSRLAGEGVAESYMQAMANTIHHRVGLLQAALAETGQALAFQPAYGVPSMVGPTRSSTEPTAAAARMTRPGNTYNVTTASQPREKSTLEIAEELRRAEYLNKLPGLDTHDK